MSLVERAKKKAQEDELAKKKEAEAKEANTKALEKSLEKLTKEVCAGLKEFNGVETKRGTLKFIRKTNSQAGILRLLRTNEAYSANIDLLFVDASIVSGYRDYSDDCRNIPYTEASVRVHTKPRPVNDSYYNYRNYELDGLGLREFHSSVRNWDDDEKVEKLLEEVADWLSPLFGK